MIYPPVVVVDEHDHVVGHEMLAAAWSNGLIHRVVYVIVRDGRGRVLLQQRADGMVLDPGCWDISAGGHVDVNPDYRLSAGLELKEELGIGHLDLQEVAYYFADTPYSNGTAARRFIKIYEGVVDDVRLHLDGVEVRASRWVTIDELGVLMTEHPSEVAEGLKQAYNQVLENELTKNHRHQTAGQTRRALLDIR